MSDDLAMGAHPVDPGAGPWPEAATVDRDRRLLAVGGVEVERLAERYGTPLWVVSRDDLVGRMRAFRAAVGTDVEVVYAAKALCVTGVLQLAVAEGLSVDVASAGELHTAVRAGVPGHRVVVHGNSKSDDELDRAARLDGALVVIDALEEVDRLRAAARAAGRRVRVALRLTPDVDPATHTAVRTGQEDSKFGLSLRDGEADEAADRVVAADELDLDALHAHLGSQLRDAAEFAAGAERMVAALAGLRARTGAAVPRLDLGGGLAVAHASGEPALALADYAGTLRAAVRTACAAHRTPEPTLMLEPGRWIAAPAGLTLYRVGVVKRPPGGRVFVAVDGGMSDNPRPALYGARYEALAAGADAPAGEPAERVELVGKHCESGDVLASAARLPAGIARGHLVAVGATGAYSHSMASSYNRLPRPAMVLVADGRATLLARREHVADTAGLDVALDPWWARPPGSPPVG